MKLRKISVDEAIPLRSRILRPGQPLALCHYPADSEAVHFGMEADGEVVCVVTAHPEKSAKTPEALNPWRLRGMATAEKFQGKRIGSQVLAALLAWAREEKIDWIWCNAREKAIPFYERHGFEAVSEFFELPQIGRHKIMRLQLR
jgi:GNAT superfamily N-acetyltransferase